MPPPPHDQVCDFDPPPTVFWPYGLETVVGGLGGPKGSKWARCIGPKYFYAELVAKYGSFKVFPVQNYTTGVKSAKSANNDPTNIPQFLSYVFLVKKTSAKEKITIR